MVGHSELDLTQRFGRTLIPDLAQTLDHFEY